MLKKIIGCLVLAALGAGSICGIVYGCKYHGLNNEYQTTDQLRNTVDELNTLTKNLKIQVSALEAKEQELTSQNEELKLQVAELQAQVEENSGNAELVVELQAQIETLNSTIEENNSKIATLTTEKNNLSARVSELESQVAQLESDLNNSEEENEDYVMRIATLEAQITSLQNEITRLNGLLESYDDIANSTFEVSFYAGDNNLKTVAVKNGKTVSELPTSDDYVITGWTLEDGTAVDPLTYEITQNTIFYAQVEYVVSFMNGSTVISTVQVAEGEKVSSVPSVVSDDTKTFNGWTLDGSTEIVDPKTVSISENISFVANCEYKVLSFSLSSQSSNNSLSGFEQMDPVPASCQYNSIISASIGGVSENSKIKIEGYLITGFSTFSSSTDFYLTEHAWDYYGQSTFDNFARNKTTLSNDLVISLGQEFEVRDGMTVKFELVEGKLQLTVSGQPSYNNMSTTPFEGGALSYIYFKVV